MAIDTDILLASRDAGAVYVLHGFPDFSESVFLAACAIAVLLVLLFLACGLLVAATRAVRRSLHAAPSPNKPFRHIVRSDRAAASPPTYSQAVVAAGLVFVSGTAPTDPRTGAIHGVTI